MNVTRSALNRAAVVQVARLLSDVCAVCLCCVVTNGRNSGSAGQFLAGEGRGVMLI